MWFGCFCIPCVCWLLLWWFTLHCHFQMSLFLNFWKEVCIEFYSYNIQDLPVKWKCLSTQYFYCLHSCSVTVEPHLIFFDLIFPGICGSIVGWGTMVQTGRSLVRFPIRSLGFLIDLVLPATLWPWGSTQPVTKMSARNLPGGKGWLAHKTDSLTAICEPIV
jgi:hypothetical protein